MTSQTRTMLLACAGGVACLIAIIALLPPKEDTTKVKPPVSRDTRQFAKAGQPLNPATRRQLVDQGNAYGRNGDWKNAYGCFRQVVAGGTKDEWEWSWATASALAAGETDTCARYCAQMLAVLGAKNDPGVAERCAKQCLAFNCPDAVFQAAAERADFAVSRNRNNRWTQLVKGMAEYRRGKYIEALDWLRQPEMSSELEVSLQACCFGALARHQLGDGPGARQALAQADSRIWVLNWTGELGHQRYNTWDNIARAMVVRAEAEQIINGQPLAPPLDPAVIPVNRQKWQAMTYYLNAAEDLGKRSAWLPAREYYTKALQHPAFDWKVFELRNDFLIHQMAAAFLMAEDQTRFRALVQMILEHKVEDLSLVNQERYAQVCVMQPDLLTPEMKTRALAFARGAYENPNAAPNPWLFLVRGVAEYREGRFAEAIATLERTSFQPSDTIAQAKAVTFQALAHKRLGHAKEAAQATQEANALFARQTSRNATWPHLVFYQIAMKELLELLASPE